MNLLTPLVVASLLPVLAQAQRPELNEREAAFVKLMSGCKMVGSFTMRGSKRAPQQESYTIAKIEKVRADRWRFFAKIQYLGVNVTVPLLVDVKWAGNTPMIQVTKMKIVPRPGRPGVPPKQGLVPRKKGRWILSGTTRTTGTKTTQWVTGSATRNGIWRAN